VWFVVELRRTDLARPPMTSMAFVPRGSIEGESTEQIESGRCSLFTRSFD